VGLLEEDDEGPVLMGKLLDDIDLACRKALDIQLQYCGSMVLIGGTNDTAP